MKEEIKRCIEVCSKCSLFKRKEQVGHIAYDCRYDYFYILGSACYGMLNEYSYETYKLPEACGCKLEHAVIGKGG